MGNVGEEDKNEGVWAVARYSHTSTQVDVLQVDAGDELVLYPHLGTKHWLYVMRVRDGRTGYLPPTHVETTDHQGAGAADNASSGENDDEDEQEDVWQDEEFFGSYGTLHIHQEMLSDTPRTEAYQRAISDNATYFAGRRVMDVGSGSGILSMFAARAGAARVFGIEASTMAYYGRANAQANGFADIIDIVECRVEADDDRLPAKGSVDIIVSEWMGTFLIFENMIESVLVARDRFLAPGGKMFPSRARLFAAPVTAADTYQRRVGFWDTQYGFAMPAMRKEARRVYTSKPLHDHVSKPADLLAQPNELINWDMHTLRKEELVFQKCPIEFSCTRDGTLHGICSWFDVTFDALADTATPVVLSTGPESPLTHWKHALLMLEEPVEVTAGSAISGSITIRRNPVWRRHFLIDLTICVGDGAPRAKTYLMWR